jgi:DNA-binding NarL/FixJ family response regulator
MQILQSTSIDVMLISASLDDGPFSGLLLVREIRKLYPSIRVVVLLEQADPKLVVDVFRSGARGVFTRSQSLKMLFKCLQTVHQGQIWASSGELQLVIEEFSKCPPMRVVDSRGTNLLSQREGQVVRLVAEGLGNREIAREMNISAHTVKNHLFRIFDKLGVSSRVDVVLYAFNSSLRADSLEERASTDIRILSPANRSPKDARAKAVS